MQGNLKNFTDDKLVELHQNYVKMHNCKSFLTLEPATQRMIVNAIRLVEEELISRGKKEPSRLTTW